MTVTATVANRESELVQHHESYVRATVVRTQRPTSARAGDVAVVDATGRMTGFVGGTCVESSVRQFSLRTLESGEPLLLRVRAGDVGSTEGSTEEEGAVEVHNPCLSGGSVDVFLEPVVPSPRMVVVGDAPVAQSLARIGAELGFETELVDGEAWQPAAGDAAVIVAAHGKGEEPALERALRAGVPYIGLIASDKRGAAVVASLNVDDALRQHVHTPAGLKLGGTKASEIALGVLAELVQVRAATGATRAAARLDDDGGSHEHARVPSPDAGQSAPALATDPVCGMTVIAADPTPQLSQDAGVVWFCSDSCRNAYRKEPARYGTP